MNHRQVSPVAYGVKGRRCLSDVIPDNGRIANLAVAEAKLEVGEADGSGVVGALGSLKRSRQEGDAARRFASSRRQPAV
jgi:hypothetical protein